MIENKEVKTDSPSFPGPFSGIGLVGFPIDDNSSYLKGASQAPPLIRDALFSFSINRWTEQGVDLEHGGIFKDLGDLELNNRNQWVVDIQNRIVSLLDQGMIPLSLGGDHSITFPIVQAFHQRLSGFSLLHLDAHPDLYDEFQGNPHSHASPFARIMERGLVTELVQVGIRTLNGHQKKQSERFGVTAIEMKDWHPDQVFRFKQPVYISLDMDVLDPAFAPGVSHFEPGGLSTRQVIDIIHRVEAPVIVGADVVEFNPDRDPSGITAMTCAKLVKEIAGKIIQTNRLRKT
jgi:arginase